MPYLPGNEEFSRCVRYANWRSGCAWVPTLRNVELTYPYFHDGAYWTLEKSVDVMARLQLGRQLSEVRSARSPPFSRP